jgi:chromate transporter
MSTATDTSDLAKADVSPGIGLGPVAAYFLKLGPIGFGGPAALVGFMHRDLVEDRRWLAEDDYRLAMALAQLMPGPLAAQCAIAIGYLLRGVVGATVVGLAFILPSFVMVLGLSVLYVAYGGLWWMQALFYGVGAAVIGIIVISAYKLALGTNKRIRCCGASSPCYSSSRWRPRASWRSPSSWPGCWCSWQRPRRAGSRP